MSHDGKMVLTFGHAKNLSTKVVRNNAAFHLSGVLPLPLRRRTCNDKQLAVYPGRGAAPALRPKIPRSFDSQPHTTRTKSCFRGRQLELRGYRRRQTRYHRQDSEKNHKHRHEKIPRGPQAFRESRLVLGGAFAPSGLRVPQLLPIGFYVHERRQDVTDRLSSVDGAQRGK